MNPEHSPNHLVLPKHESNRRLRSFQTARLEFDITVVFCDRFIEIMRTMQLLCSRATKLGFPIVIYRG